MRGFLLHVPAYNPSQIRRPYECEGPYASTLGTPTSPLRSAAVARKVDVSELVGAKEIADRIPGVTRANVVHDWRARHPEFPEPVARLAMGLVWVWADVEAWAKRTGRL